MRTAAGRLALIVGVLGALTLPAAAPAAAANPSLLGSQVIGHSVRHRPIVAYHLGSRHGRPVLIVGQMHGDERAGVTLVNAILHGSRRVEGVNLWVVPTMNPDGYAAHTRQNAHHVDLNRNFPYRWAHLSGQYYSGRRAESEPESRAMAAFLRHLRPKYVVSLHQPLDGVDTTDGGAVDHAFANRLARGLGLPHRAFRCWSTCHGSMTGWYTHRRYGVAITVEFGAHPRRAYLVGRAARAIVAALGGRLR